MFEAARSGDVQGVQEQLRGGADVHARDEDDNASALHWAAAAGALDVVQVLVDAGADVNAAGDDHELAVIGWATCFHPHAKVAAFLVERGARHHIFSAIALGLVDEVRDIVAADPGALNRRMSRNEDNRLPLQFAVDRRRTKIVALLVELGADPLGVDASGHIAAAYATTPDVDRSVMEAIHALTAAELRSAERAGREPDLRAHDLLAALALGDSETTARFTVGPGALCCMAKRGDVAAVQRCIALGAEVDALWSHWGTEVSALHLAAANGHQDVVRTLLSAGADPTIRDSRHDSDPLGWANYFEQPEVAALLEERLAAADSTNVMLEFREVDPHVAELIDAFEDGWVVGIATVAGMVRLELQTPGATWGAAVSLVEGRLDRLPFDWRSHASCKRP